LPEIKQVSGYYSNKLLCISISLECKFSSKSGMSKHSFVSVYLVCSPVSTGNILCGYVRSVVYCIFKGAHLWEVVLDIGLPVSLMKFRTGKEYERK
jgi:hypothetical protein